jgi:hypothetical protein
LQPLSPQTATPDSFMRLITRAQPLPPGTIIELAPMTQTPTRSISAGQATIAASPTTPPAWPTLSTGLTEDLLQILNTLSGSSGTIAVPGFSHLPIPQISQPQQITSAILFFMAAIRSGDLNAWLGEKAVEDIKRAGKGTTLARLGDTIGQLQRASESTPDWRSYMIPMQFGQEIKAVMLLVRRDTSEDDHEGQKKDARYVLQVEFDRIGAVQLDLLYRPGQLDTILRTEMPLSTAMTDMLVQKYAASMQRVGHTGILIFQTGAKHWVTLPPPPNALQVTA